MLIFDFRKEGVTGMEAKQESATDCLKRLMQQANIPTYRSLSQRAGVSTWVIQQLRKGEIQRLRLGTLQAIAAALNVSLGDFLTEFRILKAVPAAEGEEGAQARDRITTLTTEYQRLQAQLTQQADQIRQQVQQEALTVLEPWLLQWPTAVYAVQQNPDLPASRLIPITQPLQTLLETWDVEALAPVGTVVPYDPHQHQLLEGEAAVGDLVKVRYAGFRQRGNLLHRAKVSPTAT